MFCPSEGKEKGEEGKKRGGGGLHATFSSRNETLAACVCVFSPFPPCPCAPNLQLSRARVCQFAQPTRRTLAAAAVRPFARRLAALHGGSRTTVSFLRPTDAKPAAERGFCGLFANSCLSVRSSNVLNRARGPDALFFFFFFLNFGPSFLEVGSWFWDAHRCLNTSRPPWTQFTEDTRAAAAAARR